MPGRKKPEAAVEPYRGACDNTDAWIIEARKSVDHLGEYASAEELLRTSAAVLRAVEALRDELRACWS